MTATLNIRTKIVLTLGICAALIVTLGILSVRGLSALSSNMQAIYAQDTVAVTDLATVESSALRIRLGLMRIPAMQNPDDVKAMLQRLANTQHILEAAWRDYYPSRVTEADEQALAAHGNDAVAAFGPQVGATIEAWHSTDPSSWKPALDKLADTSQTIYDNADRIAAIKKVHGQQASADGDASFHRLLALCTGAAALSVAVAFAMGLYLVRAISRPLNASLTIADRIANGWLDNPVETAKNDEFGHLLRSLARMDTQLAGIVRGVQNASEAILSATGEIAAGNLDLSARTEEQAASLEQTAASVAQFTSTNRETTERVRETMLIAADTARVARDGDASAARMLTTIREISTQSSQIAEITAMIEGIAFQTNILALNAAVEAARAGEAGRGFAVVASEVRSLAQRASSAAKQIRELISGSLESVRAGSVQAEDVGRRMTDISTGIDRLADINAELFATAEEQARGLEQVNTAVGQLDEVAQQNAALVEQSAAATQSLVDQADQQRDMLSAFRFTIAPRGSDPRHPPAFDSGDTALDPREHRALRPA